jgi:hypothetical protein
LRSVVRPLAERIEELQQLDGAGEALKSLVDRYVPPRTELKDLLSGTWLGHPLHPVLTDVVLGAWTSSFLLDLIPGRRTRKASDRLVDIGILAAAPTALAGLSDWADTWGRPRRVGLVAGPQAGAAAARLVAVGDRLRGDYHLGLPRRPPLVRQGRRRGSHRLR